ncbi:MAG: polyketide synthase, partial [Bryobacteraceae bacterium]|nr:polyketide synthase [Bryobacteraceae bacterium]
MSVGESLASGMSEPIAIVGMGCRFPAGASNPEAFWRLLCNGIDGITEVPAERWDARRFYDPDPAKPGKTYVKQGGFLRERVEYFDPLAFGISPREAPALDPQQRLLLEVTWEALEDAGLRIESLAGSATGVFIGAFTLDMKMLQSNIHNRDRLTSHSTTGSSMTLMANRLSYVFDWRGPSIAIDTACSSSLVAAHYA